ncbi:RagB/SusD family nutrient uptake outer membrane protein [Proteiniphilum sp.]|uniref:RagB/SusD family nutrient uptake outer membrane protein n=1 Tax=Proteiniphilum sp. TaxID=1926877 RepID=UPI002B1E9849|nr:RagB/SusD family nutrient uptake outer membrane protein [Proteiniphilum sp.]MEA4918289.1 RagB/SusD family nutrient uptake outer membrane protein [Proteiniphilum sp.]
MKKNYFIHVILAVILVLGFAACDDKQGGNIIEGENIDDNAALALINSAWRPYQTLSSTFTSLIDTPVDGYTSFLGKEDDDCTFAAQIKIEHTNLYPRKTFNALYKSIGIVNDAINKINNSDQISEKGKDQAIAQAKFQRALYYSYLVQLWGEVPLLLETGGDAKRRSSIDDVYTQIVKDLKEAATVLPAGNGLTKPTNPAKGAANALLARVYLAWGNNPLTQQQVAAIANNRTDPTVSYNRDLLDSAVVYADKVINSNLYSLLPDFRNLWGRANESKGPEQIFTIHHDGDGIDQQGNHQTHCANHDPWNEKEPAHIQPVHTYDWWSDDDPRKAFSVLTELRDPVTDSLHLYQWPYSLPRNGKGVDRSYTNSAYLTQLTNDVDRIEIRYAEVLITKAEALVQLGKGNAEATRLINQIRKRAFGDTSHNIASVTLKDVQDEWEYEFQYEQHRWLNLTRWKNLISTVLTLVPTYTYYDEKFADPDNIVTVNGIEHRVGAVFARYHKHLRGKYENVKGRNYRFPIPQGSNFEDLGIRPQNPGYGDPVAN